MNKLTLNDVCTFKDGEIASVDLSKVYLCSQNGVNKLALRKTEEHAPLRLTLDERPQRPDGAWTQLFNSMMSESALPAVRNILSLAIRPFKQQSLTLASPKPVAVPDVRDLGAATLPPQEKVPIATTRDRSPDGAKIEDIEMNVPFGMPRYVNVPTLRAILGRRDSEPLLRKTESGRWEVCPESYMVDLANPNVLFQIGPLNIYS